jgi:hypothetical protein
MILYHPEILAGLVIDDEEADPYFQLGWRLLQDYDPVRYMSGLPDNLAAKYFPAMSIVQ